MARASWISFCFLLVRTACPLAEHGEVLETNKVTMFKSENVTIQVNESRGGVSENKSAASSGSECGNCNTKQPKTAQSKSDMTDLIHRSGNTRRLHSRMKKILHTYKQGTASVHSSNLISSVSNYLGQYIPSLRHSNTSTNHTRKDRSVKTNQSHHANTYKISNDGYNVTNSSGYIDSRKQTKQHMLRKGLGKAKIEREEEVKEEEDKTTITENSNATVSSNTTESPTLTDQGTIDAYMSCQHSSGFNSPRWLKMVVHCPQNWTDRDTQLKCEFWQELETGSIMDELTLLPVQDQNGTVFANVFCAKCHQVTFMLPWVSRFNCNKTSTQTFQLSDFTDLDFLYANLLTSTCQRDIIPSIPQTLAECQMEAQPFMGLRKAFSMEADVLSASYPVSFTVIMNFDFTGNTHILFTANQKIVEEEYTTECQVGETFDPYSNSCRKLTCSTDYTLEGNDCVPTGDTPSSSDDITELSQLRTVHIVTLQLNITFGEFLLLKYQIVEPEIIPQIAGYLNISQERLKDVNITYELGSISGSALQVRPLTEKEYSRMLQENPPHNGTSSGDPRFDWKSTSQQPTISDVNGDRSRPAKPDKGLSRNKEKQDRYRTRMNITVPDSKSGVKPIDHKEKPLATGRKSYTRSPLNITLTNVGDFNETNKQLQTDDGLGRKVKPVTKYNLNPARALLANGSRHTLARNKKLFQHSFKYRGKQVSTKYANFFRYHFKYPANETVMYISEPVNEKHERVSLLISESQSLQQLLDQSMVMRISFVLLPPDGSQSNEAESRDILRKMDSLIFEQQFSLKLNGKDVDVVAVDDLTEDNEMMDFCPLGVEYLVSDDEFMMVDMDNTTALFDNKTNSFVRFGMFDLFLVVSGSNEAGQTNFTDMTQYAFICFMPRISEHNCDMINLNSNEYYVAGENKSIVFEDKQYDIFQYRFLDEKTGSIQICVPSTFAIRNMTVHSYVTTIDNSCSSDFEVYLRAEGYMTLVLGRVSIAALACVLITYILFRGLRNLPGLNLMNLTFALLVTQIIFASGIEENESCLCKVVAVSLHYTLLAAHFWMNVVSYDVYQTFTNPVIQNRAREIRKYFYRYALYAWGAPLCIVSLCMFIDFSNLFSGVSIGYGAVPLYSDELNSTGDNITASLEGATSSNDTSITDEKTIHTCWITQPLAALIAFGAIILLIFLINCIFFAKTIACISKTARMAKKSLGARNSNSSVHKRTDTSEVMLYVRMSTVMGFTWIFGLGSSILSSFVSLPTNIACTVVHVLSILFTILNTSQGFLIFIAFVCNRRVMGLYMELFRKAKLLLVHGRRSGIFSVSSTLSSSQTTQQSR